MPLIGGKNAKKKSSSSSTKRHFTVVIGNKEHGLYVSSSPSSAARKAVSKLCATDKKKKVEFQIREITQGSKKKTYGPYLGAIEKLDKPIELKGRVIKYKPVAKLLGKKTKTGGAKKKGSVLVVQSKDGKVSKKYITEKQADKHMKPRHKRLDKGMKALHKSMDKSMKKLHKSMRGGATYTCNTKIFGTNHTFSVKYNADTEEYIIHLHYYDHPSYAEQRFPASQLFSKCRTNNIQRFLNDDKNRGDLIFSYSQKSPPQHLTFNDVLNEFVKYVPHMMAHRGSGRDHTVRINDTFHDADTNYDEDGMRTPYPSDKQLVAQIMSMLEKQSLKEIFNSTPEDSTASPED